MSAKVGRMPMPKEISSNAAAKEHTLVVTRDFISQPRISKLICTCISKILILFLKIGITLL